MAGAAAAALLLRRQAATGGAPGLLCSLEALCLPLSVQLADQVARTGWTASGCSRRSSCDVCCPSQRRRAAWQHPWRHADQQQHGLLGPLSLHLYSTRMQQAHDGSGEPGSQQQQQQQQQRQRQQGFKLPPAAEALQAAGWSRREVLNVPNLLSMLRLLSGPLIAGWILDAKWSLAVPALALSGASDWADGYVARRFNQPSVVGSYLDPLADKVLICSVVGALGWSGTLPASVVALVVGRDAGLVAGAFAARARSLGWRWPGWAEFFRVQSAVVHAGGAGGTASTRRAAGAVPAADDEAAAGQPGAGTSPAAEGGGEQGAAGAPAAPLVQPLYISKVNTVFQLGLVGACMLNAWLGWPGEAAVNLGIAATATTTVWSSFAYLQAYRQGRILAPVASR